MIKIQVAYGQWTAADAQCKRCGGGGRDPVATQSACVYCGGSGMVLEALGRAYTYLAPEGMRLFDLVYVDAPGGRSQIATVVSLTSDYAGPMKECWPLPATVEDCPGCGRPSTFAVVGVKMRVRAWLKSNPA